MLRYLSMEKEKLDKIKRLRTFIMEEEFDTDSIEMDTSKIDIDGSNIGNILQDKDLQQSITEFFEIDAEKARSFAIGYIFYYWHYYKDMLQFDGNTFENDNDHGGYFVKDLYIKPKFKSFKQEIENYAWFDFANYDNILIPKVKAFYDTVIVKKTKADTFLSLVKYGLSDGDPLSFDHLLSIILYTDYTDLSRDFSSSFRPLTPYEPLNITKQRNTNYFWMSKALRETVEIFGGDNVYPSTLKGPFYCGLSVALVFPDTEVRLCSPTSTTKHLEVATRFGGQQGIVVELQNDINMHEYLRGFYCGWISQFREEEETLFFGGHYRIRIASIRNMKTHDNHQTIMQALSKFSRLFHGQWVRNPSWEESDFVIIKALFLWKLGKVGKNKKIKEYIYKSFQAFCDFQTAAKLDMLWIEDVPVDLRELMVYDYQIGKLKVQ